MMDKEIVRKEADVEAAALVNGKTDGQTIDKITNDIDSKSVRLVEEEAKKTGFRSEMNGVEVDFELQYRDRETDMKDIAARVTEDYVRRGNDADTIQLIHVYLKPTDFTAYYVINDVYEGKIPLF
ncbi:MAG: hypothetical protein K2N73_16210 [Lachnospiraceae bacterium]|nr:hypothetical protein [Lachnospiraceae bacterium]